jgi:hypothetical protein
MRRLLVYKTCHAFIGREGSAKTAGGGAAGYAYCCLQRAGATVVVYPAEYSVHRDGLTYYLAS